MSQNVMWSYFQNENPEVFLGSETRFRALLKIAGAERGEGNLLNIGAGNGDLERRARREGFKVASLDPDERTCARLAAEGIDARPGMIENLPFKADTFDVVIATEVLEHLTAASMHAGLAQITRVLKTGGRFIGTVPYREELARNMVVCPDCKKVFHPRGHQQSFSVELLRLELAGHFTVEMCRAVLYPPWTVLNWKGKLGASMSLLLSFMGVHGSNANLLFVGRKTVAQD